MFRRILIANRGEIALRIIRTCQELGVETVAVYSDVDASSLHVAAATRAVCIGPREPRQSYLNQAALITAAQATGAEAIHPGYGFLAENAAFAQACADAGLKFIGPSPASIELMGHKAQAKETMRAAGVPTIPGSDGVVADLAAAQRVAEAIGYPLLVKAAAGGGGKGMRIVRSAADLPEALMMAQMEARAAFGDDSVYLERLLERARHVEVQVLGDQHGQVVALGERDCSLQRRSQKLIEEAPAPGLRPEVRAALAAAAVRGCAAIGYQSAGTVEFLYDAAREAFYFIEMNTRIQVEHPVTEMVTGIDLVREQLRVAAGEPLGYGQGDVQVRGHAIECRINAEDPAQGFRPNAGHIGDYRPPGGPWLRVDSHCYPGF
ncbi:MAG: acetyl-CoA carboxylase biotin carboxylase subunit, partial [Chloroflexi bacterium]|nr:acetyl-CoA carboxylase biotin carboxylase subunit [Chloroflexota bacterium]